MPVTLYTIQELLTINPSISQSLIHNYEDVVSKNRESKILFIWFQLLHEIGFQNTEFEISNHGIQFSVSQFDITKLVFFLMHRHKDAKIKYFFELPKASFNLSVIKQIKSIKIRSCKLMLVPKGEFTSELEKFQHLLGMLLQRSKEFIQTQFRQKPSDTMVKRKMKDFLFTKDGIAYTIC